MTDEGSKAELAHNIALSYLNDVRERFNDEEKYAYFTQVFKDFSSRRIGINCVIERVMKLFENHQDLLLGFNAFLPKDYAIILPKEDESAPVETPDRFQEAIEFINKIKARFKDNGHVYQTFLHILNMYGKKAKTVKEVNKEVIELFGDHIDLIEEFGDYLPGLSGQAADDTPRPRRKHNSHRYYRSSAEHATGTRCVENTAASQDGWDYNVDEPGPDLNNFAKGNQRRMQKKSKKEMERRDSSKVRKRKLDDEDYDSGGVQHVSPIHKTALKVEDYVTDEFDQEAFWNNEHQPISVKVNGGDRDLYHEKRYKDRDPKNRDRERLDRVASGYKDESGSKTSLLFSSKDEAVVKPIQELDLSNCESCTPSYRLLPKNYPVPSVSHRTESDANVLNDNWVSVTSGSEDYSFKHMRKNQYEESLFRCEDDRYELDMLIESAKAARRNVKDWLSKIKDNTRETSSMNIEHHLTASNLRCIERVYGDHGLDVMDSLRNNPLYSMKVVSRRLKQKVKEWTKCRSDSSEVWAEVYAKNHHRSLDHRSFYFKLQDSKNLSSKALLAEIKEISKDQEKEDDVLFSFVTGTRQPVIPNLEFQLPDYDIHFYVYRLIEIASQYMCTAERFGRVLKVYTTLLEPMLGGSSHLKRADTEGDSIKSNSVTHCAGETDGSPVGIRQSVVANGPLGHSNNSSWLVKNNGGSGIDNIPDPDHILLHCDTKYEVDPHLEKVQINVNQMDETVRQPDCSSILATAVKDNYGRVYEVDKPGFFATMEYSKDAVNGQLLENLPLSAEGGECSKPTSDLIEAMTESINGHKCDEESRGRFAIEREEGELSPYGDDEDHILQAHGEADEKPEDSATSMHRETKSEENEVENDVDDDDDKDGMHLKAVKPLAMHAPLLLHYKEKEKSSQIFYGSDSFYLLFRLYQTLYDRIKSMKSSAERQCRVSNDTNPSDLCSSFLNAFCQLLDGSSDNTEFEDNCRTLIGAESYVLFTLDKLVKKLVNQLETIATSDLDNKLLQLYAYEKSRGGGFVDILYHNNARVLLQDDEYMFRIECSYEPLRLSMQLMDYGYNKPGQYALCMDQKVASYMYNYLLLSEEQERGVVLKRNKPKFARDDELYDTNQAMEGLQIYNGLECRIMVPSLRVGYVLGTEDFLYRKKKKKTIHCNGNSGDQCNGKKVRGLDRLLMMSCLEE